MKQNKTNLVLEPLGYITPSARIHTLFSRNAVLQGSGDGTGQIDPIPIGGED